MSVSLADLLPNLLADASWSSSSDVILDRFLEYAAGRRLTLYRAQEEAILELLDGKGGDQVGVGAGSEQESDVRGGSSGTGG